MEDIKKQIQALNGVDFAELRRWIFDDEVQRRQAQPAVEQAQAEVVKELQDAGKLPLPDALTDPEKLPVTISDVPEWVNPGTDHSMMYREGDIVRYGDKLVRSTHPGLNHWEPGTLALDGRIWEGITPKTPEEPEAEASEEETQAPEPPVEQPEAFKQPTGAHDAYAKGAKVTYNGAVYESLIDANAYSPDAYPAGWKKLA
ncbi:MULTISPECIES: hypothetical protein [unclassified Corynebacterium]|uniref:hypothetical protein n=1 Tax=unclassified Corynebacterium TaxID=2624378 RepID=UPI0003B7E213|nr:MULTISPECIES: hypothetical protein [unclassified Corynebacterium]ERS41816.1 hypothetical protein HMPREF1293_01967 [Corynebacterium sp. KPL1996]ERS44645.1 hypothetical protein HMPREF1287_01138 [Corynebacterium sp. KPL1986]ERS72570.1 hypothetical protein HMPREF1295_01497 [Corynebacterium sp. KPL1998]ERS73971.1 hypothetical protein HMPREF1300_00954 [Corynebacterium sp. KPL2004]